MVPNMNILIKITYDGTAYHGYQMQKNLKTVELELTKAISKTLKKKTKIYSAGRTDRGVHALGQYANFFADTTINIGNLPRVINFHLPSDISVVKAQIVDENFHARFSAKAKKYRYILYNSIYRNALYYNRAYQFPFKLNLHAMEKSFECLIGEHDFNAFMGRDAVVKDTIRNIYSIDIKKDGEFIYFDFYGKSFLKNMIRIIMGTALEIARGKFEPSYMEELLNSKKRAVAGPTAPASGLYLMDVIYLEDCLK